MNLTLGDCLRRLPGPVLITGHTGFKGVWLTLLLESLEVPVIGFSLPPEQNSLYSRARRSGAITESHIDVRNFDSVHQFITNHKPSAVIHLAAQPLVLESYLTPRETFETNVTGTVNILESSFKTDSVQAVLVVTTDKVYRNSDSEVAFIESDPLRGKDPYSASKVGAEAAVAAWQQISLVSGGPKVISVRAGNVIGGGDWAKDRIIPELVRGFSKNELVLVRNPESTRPWQHVLDPLRGYVMALEAILNGAVVDTLNFGPDSQSLSVQEVVEISKANWPLPTFVEFSNVFHDKGIEAKTLQLESKMARSILCWNNRWNQADSVVATIKWWDKVLNKSIPPVDACQSDLDFLFSN